MPPRRVVFKYARARGPRLAQYVEYGGPGDDHRGEIDEPRLSSSAFWKARSGLTSYSDLQEDFFNKISCKYGAVRGESKSLLKNTNAEQAKRFRARTAISTTSPRLLTICLSDFFGEQPKISVPGLDFCDKIRYHRINFPNREYFPQQTPNKHQRMTESEAL